MSQSLTCDLCGESIADDEPRGVLHALTIGGVSRGASELSQASRAFHASPGRDCFGDALTVIDSMRSAWSGERYQHSTTVRAMPETWKELTTPREREHHVLNALGDDNLTIRQIRATLTERSDAFVSESVVTSTVTRLHKRGDLDREPETYDQGRRVRFRYFRPALEGPIADLNRQMDA